MNKYAVDLADQILQMEPAFYGRTRRHIGIIAAHAEIWCAHKFRLELGETAVRAGADGRATSCSPPPLAENDTLQIKGRGSHETMHITYNTRGIMWLLVVTYDLLRLPVVPRAFLVKTTDLVQLAEGFAQGFGEPALPVRVMAGQSTIRIEWPCLLGLGPQDGPVRRTNDTWEARRARAEQVRSMMYLWNDIDQNFVQRI